MAREQEWVSRYTEDYIISQIIGFRETKSFLDHKRGISDFDKLYQGDIRALFPDESGLDDNILIENKLKNATHDLARLASEAKGAHFFMKEGESQAAAKRASVRGAIADTQWVMGEGRQLERKLYMDAIVGGMMAVACYYDSQSDYPQYLRLNPRSCYPDVWNGKLQSMVYLEQMKERQAAGLWPDLGLNNKVENKATVTVSTFYDKKEVVVSICTEKKGSVKAKAHIVDRWEHGLGCVPVAFVALDSADESMHGLFDQLGGPMMVRNKIIRLLADYLESMTHAPLEAKGVLNATAEPGPLTVYQHDETAPESFIRRVAPAAPAGGVFGLLQYMDSQESAEAIQPPARVGVVRQSIASGSFVDSTQGTLSSVVYELQECMAALRMKLNHIAFKVDEKYLDKEKPLYRAIGNKNTYTPSEDLKGFYHHTVQYGAAAGLNRAEAGVRVLQDMGAGLISKEKARGELDYVDDPLVEQDRIDREQLANVFFQRFSADPNTPVSLIANMITEMGKGKGLLDVIKDLAPQLVAMEEEKKEAAAGPVGPEAPEGAPEDAAAQQQQLQAGGELLPVDSPSQPLQQQIVRNIF